MKKPSLIQIIAIVNSILVIYMLYTVYELKKPRMYSQDAQHKSVSDAELLSADVLLSQLENSAASYEILPALQRLPRLDAAQAKRLHRWLSNDMRTNIVLNHQERLNTQKLVYEKLINSEYDVAALASELLNQVQDSALWIPERNQAFVHLFLLYVSGALETDPLLME